MNSVPCLILFANERAKEFAEVVTEQELYFRNSSSHFSLQCG
jgi:hypothetical protein